MSGIILPGQSPADVSAPAKERPIPPPNEPATVGDVWHIAGLVMGSTVEEILVQLQPILNTVIAAEVERRVALALPQTEPAES